MQPGVGPWRTPTPPNPPASDRAFRAGTFRGIARRCRTPGGRLQSQAMAEPTATSSTPVATTERRTLRFDTFDEVIADVRQLELGYTRLGKWTLAQASDHLAKFMRFSLEGFPGRRLPRPISAVLRRVILTPAKLDRSMPAGLRTAGFLVPAPPAEGEDAKRADHDAAARLVEMCRRVKHHGGEFFPSPIFGNLTPATWRLVHLRHCELHLSFLVPTSVTP